MDHHIRLDTAAAGDLAPAVRAEFGDHVGMGRGAAQLKPGRIERLLNGTAAGGVIERGGERQAGSFAKGNTLCTRPLPKLVSPTMVARSWSCMAPETISEALADLPSIRMASLHLYGVARKEPTRFSPGTLRPRTVTISAGAEEQRGRLDGAP